MANVVLPTEQIARKTFRGWRYSPGIACGPLAAVQVTDVWFVIHRASGERIGSEWNDVIAAVLYAGALLNLPINWESANPVLPQQLREQAQTRIEALQ